MKKKLGGGTMVMGAALAALGLSMPMHAAAQVASPPPAATEEDEATDGTKPQTSTEQGQTPIDESFGARTHADWVRETRRKAWEDTKWDIQLRSYTLIRDKFDGSETEGWAVGGWAGAKTGYFRERFAFGATAYGSVPVSAPEDKDGTLLLKPGGDGYGVLGELYVEALLNDDIRLSVGRRGIDTPYINRNDNRMTPNTFEQITLQGLHGGGKGEAEWRWGGGFFNRIKERNSDEFVSMAEDAGALDGVERGVYALGGNYKKGNFSFGAINYYSDDIINIFYTETKYAIPLSEAMRLSFAFQYTDQTSTGDELLKGFAFDSRQWGAKSELGYKGLLLTAAYTSAGGNANMQGPWSGYPGYTSVQVEDFNRDGEDAWLLRAGYNFASVPGLSMYGLYVDGSKPDAASEYAKSEYDLNLQWAPPEGTFKGLQVRLRYGEVSQDDPANSKLDDLRIMVYYVLPQF
ncbi:MAG TPA: OprD family outer membrane porin [Thermomonas sp.]|nr:OprD family outer membrane porin [Thermomonas sp.]